MSRWFRWYEGTCEDGKFRVVARNAGVTVATVMGVWATLLEDASNADHRGVAVRGEDFYAAILDLDPAELQRILERMDDIGLISAGHDAITITKWKERQFETDASDATNADRQRRWREKRKSNDIERKRNGSVTATKRPETETETETETEAEKKETRVRALAVGCPPDFREQFWSRYPHKVGKPKALAKLEACMRRGVAFADIMVGLENYIAAKPADRAWLNPETFINQERWADQPAQVASGPPPGRPENAYRQSQQETKDLLNELENFATGRGNVRQADIRLLPGNSGIGQAGFHLGTGRDAAAVSGAGGEPRREPGAGNPIEVEILEPRRNPRTA